MNYNLIKKDKFSFIFFSIPECKVCTSTLNSFKNLSRKYKGSNFTYIDLSKHSDAKGFFSIFTVPAIIVYSEEKELIREARFFNFEEIEKNWISIIN
jgi:thiol-disulfide isomerase/thioredoxin